VHEGTSGSPSRRSTRRIRRTPRSVTRPAARVPQDLVAVLTARGDARSGLESSVRDATARVLHAPGPRPPADPVPTPATLRSPENGRFLLSDAPQRRPDGLDVWVAARRPARLGRGVHAERRALSVAGSRRRRGHAPTWQASGRARGRRLDASPVSTRDSRLRTTRLSDAVRP
jgi:hypothetical protein